jgi:hypothetical protein
MQVNERQQSLVLSISEKIYHKIIVYAKKT